jgi:drug/metabolite transporter (DMT)-like permease
MPASEWPWLLGAIAFGGVLGPLLLMAGLSHTTAASASLFLNLEAVLTAMLAWLVFKESADRRIVLGMVLIVAGGAVLAWPTGDTSATGLGPLALTGACLAWGIDNNLTRRVSASDALFVAGSKGLVIGFVGYGLSLVLFVLALRALGTARTGAYFSIAPFVGAAISIAVFSEPTSPGFWMAASLMATGVWLHLTEHHTRTHEHDFEWDPAQPHTHVHQHAALKHRHAHFPDIHHRHAHRWRNALARQPQ